MIEWFFAGFVSALCLVWMVGSVRLRAERKWLDENAALVIDMAEQPKEVVMAKHKLTDSEYELQKQVAMSYLRYEVYG